MTSILDLEHGQDDNVKTPLLKEKNEDHLKLFIQEKGKSRVKWTVFGLLFFNSISLYLSVLSVSAVEDSLLKLYDWNSAQFSTVILMVPAIALFSSMFTPLLINIYSVNVVQLASFIMLTLGQFLTFTGVRSHNNTNASYGQLYSGRALVGIALGINEVGLLTTLFLWFSETKWIGPLSSLLFASVELGSLIARYAETPLVSKYDDVSLAFTYSTGFSFLSIIGQFVLIYYDNQFKEKLVKERNMNRKALHYKIERNFSLIFKSFGYKQWALCLGFMVNSAIVIVYYLQMTVPVMEKYGVSESYADIMLSTTSLLVFIGIPVIGGLMALKKDVLVAIGGVFFVCLGLALYFVPKQQSNVTLGWFSIAFFGLGAPVIVAAEMSALFASIQPELVSVTNAMNSFGYFTLNAILAGCFGVIENKYNSGAAIGMLLAVAASSLLILVPLTCLKNEESETKSEVVESV